MSNVQLANLFHERSPYYSCVEACIQTWLTADACADVCFEDPKLAWVESCLRSDLDCAAICRTTAWALTRGSSDVMLLCRLCAEVCEYCAEVCDKHDTDHCRLCAEACRRCAAECRRVSFQMAA